MDCHLHSGVRDLQGAPCVVTQSHPTELEILSKPSCLEGTSTVCASHGIHALGGGAWAGPWGCPPPRPAATGFLLPFSDPTPPPYPNPAPSLTPPRPCALLDPAPPLCPLTREVPLPGALHRVHQQQPHRGHQDHRQRLCPRGGSSQALVGGHPGGGPGSPEVTGYESRLK